MEAVALTSPPHAQAACMCIGGGAQQMNPHEYNNMLEQRTGWKFEGAN